ncbi:helix-turn-helix transcriptional regulator [Staphylococcus marylandisciuri]|nr:response regulator transcription factor [Staphylococcus marylandisciuri]
MTRPLRCYGGVLLAISNNDSFRIREGEEVREISIALINEGNLFQIQESNVVMFYFSSTIILEKLGIDVFKNDLRVNSEVLLQNQLISLFDYYKKQALDTQKAINLLNDIMNNLLKDQKKMTKASNELLSGILEYIIEYLNIKITLEDISKQFYISTSNISSLFKNYFHISFYEYVTSLRVAKSISDLRTTKLNVETISLNRGYSNATNYIIHFKKYVGITPKKYRMIPNESGFLKIKEVESDWNVIQTYDFEEKNLYKHTHISLNDEEILQSSFSYFNLIDIGGYKNLDLILDEQIFNYKNFDNYKLDSYIYINDAVDNFITEKREEQSLKLRKLLKTKVSIALKINSLESLKLIEKLVADLHFLESEHLSSSNIRNGNILLLLDSNNIKNLDINKIQRNLYETRVFISVDITDSYIKNKEILTHQIYTLNPDYYHINFDSINNGMQKSYDDFDEFHRNLNAFLENIQAYKNIIFLNYEKIYPSDVLKNIGKFLEVSLYSKKYLAGSSIHFNKSSENQISIFDEIENKTLFFHIGIMLLNFSKYRCFYGESYIITKNMHGYNILLFNSDSKIADENDEHTHVFYINFQNSRISNDVIISEELLNSDYGSIDGIVSSEIENRKIFPDSLKYKLSQYNSPKLSVNKYNQKTGSYTVKLPPRSVVMLTIYL